MTSAPKLYLAPLAEFTDAPFRRLCFEGGADRAYTEMVSADALFHGHAPTRRLMERMDGEGELWCQIFGGGEREIAFTAREVEKVKERFAGIDLNAGCPMPRIVRSGAGASLVSDPPRLGRLVKAIRENTSLPVSVKTRLGPRRGVVTVFELADAAAHEGAREMTVHARYTSQMHGGPVDFDTLANLVSATPLEVCGNGSVKTRGDVERMLSTGVKAVMIGRAALGDPGIFAFLKNGVRTDFPEGPAAAVRHLGYLLEFRRFLAGKYPAEGVPDEDGYASIKMHTHLFRYFSGQPGAAKLRSRLSAIRTLEEVRRCIDWKPGF